MLNVEKIKLPYIRIKSIRFQNYKVFSDYTFDFVNSNDSIKNFLCFIGPNGTGKSTILSATRMLFGNFSEMTTERLNFNLGRAVRHSNGYKDNSLTNDDFCITAKIQTDVVGCEEYEVVLNRNGFLKDHPIEIKENLYRLYFYTRFDQELQNFQLIRSQWGTFKNIFEAITGYKIKEKFDVFSSSFDDKQKGLLDKYVLAFTVKKPHETILHKECSDGERKIIKSFSTLLNLEIKPQIIMTDNVEMHVESSRHLRLTKEMKSCFPDSQIFTTTHSYHISRNFTEREQIYDLRIIHAKPAIVREPWRLYIIDEINDKLTRILSLLQTDETTELYNYGVTLIKKCNSERFEINKVFQDCMSLFTSRVDKLYINDLIKK